MGSISNSSETHWDRSSQICRSILMIAYIECLPWPSRARIGRLMARAKKGMSFETRAAPPTHAVAVESPCRRKRMLMNALRLNLPFLSGATLTDFQHLESTMSFVLQPQGCLDGQSSGQSFAYSRAAVRLPTTAVRGKPAGSRATVECRLLGRHGIDVLTGDQWRVLGVQSLCRERI
jgi:hypothetical protein